MTSATSPPRSSMPSASSAASGELKQARESREQSRGVMVSSAGEALKALGELEEQIYQTLEQSADDPLVVQQARALAELTRRVLESRYGAWLHLPAHRRVCAARLYRPRSLP